MTQPQPPQESNAPTVVAVAVVGLALIAVEARVRDEVEQDIAAALTAFAALLALVVAAGLITTGVALMSTPQVHTGLTKSLEVARRNVATTVAGGYTAAAQVAHTRATTDLADYPVPTAIPELGGAADQLNRDITTMFGHAQTDITNRVTAAFDAAQGDNPAAARQLDTQQAVTDATNRLQHRAAATAATAVHQGATDAQQAIYGAYDNSTGTHQYKRWVVTSANPCGMCLALHGTVVAVTDEFDHHATTTPADLRPVWRTLHGPPRHPNCRCQLELLTTT